MFDLQELTQRHGGGSTWLGGNDRGERGNRNWYWEHSNQDLHSGFTDWHAGHSNVYFRDCLLLNEHHQFRWGHRYCFLEHSSICEMVCICSGPCICSRVCICSGVCICFVVCFDGIHLLKGMYLLEGMYL